MATKALTISHPIHVPLPSWRRKELKEAYLKDERKADAEMVKIVLDKITILTGQTIDLGKVIIANPYLSLVLGFTLVEYLQKKKLLTELTGNVLETSAIIGSALNAVSNSAGGLATVIGALK